MIKGATSTVPPDIVSTWESGWTPCTPQSVAEFSAAAYIPSAPAIFTTDDRKDVTFGK